MKVSLPLPLLQLIDAEGNWYAFKGHSASPTKVASVAFGMNANQRGVVTHLSIFEYTHSIAPGLSCVGKITL